MKKAAEVEHSEGEPRLSAYQQAMRKRLIAAPVVPAPEPWRPVALVPVGGLLGIGFASHPDSGHDLVMVVSHDGHGLFDAVTGEKIARERDPAPEDSTPDAVADLSCPGLGPVTGSRVHIAGLFGGGLHTTTEDGWSLEVVTPAWPNERVLLSRDGGLPHAGRHGERWWHVFHSYHSELRAVGFSPSGRTIAVATSSDVSLWARE
ncbi:hypothetical protein ADL00_05030 [Streptomyces sp. AS58]|uniref:WD40 repeat domain-containing protein n=1 Tax=Streptomyces cadmiisoli TaxID=2184053 RepID=A0A2Z4JAW7_9ACTN|nr:MULTISPECIES: hypothetical protein [Streptomyces]AWW42219.1 hypothetical protein DN051_03040 [Streptomyces cadmiisoli]KOV72940.1 hypothetical protein ADL00_05030 [Streptomyces sp. AS58]